MPRPDPRSSPVRGVLGLAATLLLLACGPPAELADEGAASDSDTARAQADFTTDEAAIRARESFYDQNAHLGEGSEKIRREDGEVYVWAGGAESGPDAEWFEFTGAPMPPEDLQYGIGADRIEAIDDPVFVEPDDPRLMDIPPSPYRPDERPTENDEIPVIGYLTDAGEARAYPTALLDQHEVVNDRSGEGKPFTVGW